MWVFGFNFVIKSIVPYLALVIILDQSSLNAGHKYCRMLQGEHSAILSTFINLPFVIKILVLSILSGRFTQVLLYVYFCSYYSKTYVKRPLSKRPTIGFQDQLSLNAGHTYCRMLQGEHSAILSPFINLPFVIKIFVLSIFE